MDEFNPEKDIKAQVSVPKQVPVKHSLVREDSDNAYRFDLLEIEKNDRQAFNEWERGRL
jgi:hypothetical protein